MHEINMPDIIRPVTDGIGMLEKLKGEHSTWGSRKK